MISIINIFEQKKKKKKKKTNITWVSNEINHTHKIIWDLKEEELSVHCVLER